ncbi:MAG: hypothetical protein ABJH98_05530 [Reichenbachiella sp.]|uniref:hypothetical protein n=1 Tax=Reichenbachiella sp. TaxID=2184521 RepID=UPI003296E708
MKYSYSLIVVLGLLVSCAPKLSFTWTKPGYETAKYQKIAIFSSGKNLEIAMKFQDTMVEYLGNEGITAISGMAIMNPTQIAGMDEAAIHGMLLKEGIDAVISVSLVDKDKSVDYVHGTNTYMYGGYGGYGFGGYYGYRYGPSYYDPGYYQETTTYLLENHFYEVSKSNSKDDALIWASQSQISDPSKSITKTYSKLLVNTLIKEGIVK